MDRENLEVFKTLIVKELTRTELEERCYELYEKCILLTDELLNKSHLPHVINNEGLTSSEGVAVCETCRNGFWLRKNTKCLDCGRVCLE